MQKDFDKAELAYEAIALERPEDAEAYWCAMLCHYGVEYVKDPYSGEQLPTLHRMQTEPVLKDMNYLRAAALADPAAKELYEREAGRISVIQDRFLTISSKEKPFDAFICYKETDENGGRTPDSVYAQEIYDALTARGHHVFFSRITLENKLGEAYEPYIFAALNSARVMLVVGTRTAYLQSEWVRNEWKRFLYLMESDPAKRLIPVYRDMDAYELPEEFAYLQAQDYGKIGAQQDLLRGVEKFIGVKRGETDEAPGAQPRQAPQPASVHAQPPRHAPGDKISPLMRRAELFLEDGELDEAEAYFNRVLDLAPGIRPGLHGQGARQAKPAGAGAPGRDRRPIRKGEAAWSRNVFVGGRPGLPEGDALFQHGGERAVCKAVRGRFDPNRAKDGLPRGPRAAAFSRASGRGFA